MRKIVTILVGFLIFSLLATGQNGLLIQESLTMKSRILHQEIRFSVCLPANYYETNKRFPVVYLLHGLGDDETSWLEYGQISHYAAKAVAEKEIVPMIFIIPQGFRTYYVNDYKSSFLYQDMFVKELVPHIDSIFRTIPEKEKRAVMGYSMGGFGAMMLPLKHPEMFGISVPLSMSVRTDGQYMTEDASGWDDQWGRLFGEPGFIETARITDYYKKNSPFHLLSQMSTDNFTNLRIYMDNGDKEQTLCRSNEELHILMRNLNIPHEYRVRKGGHSFEYWCSALPNAFHFISDAFEGKPYRGDKPVIVKTGEVCEKQVQTLKTGEDEITVIVPEEYDQTSRLYPVLLLNGHFDLTEKKRITGLVNLMTEEIAICPMILVFLNEKDTTGIFNTINWVGEKVRIRQGSRFMAIAGYESGAEAAFLSGLQPEKYCAVILSDGNLTKEKTENLTQFLEKEELWRTSFFIEAPDDGRYFEGNGFLHIMLRDKDIYHEYRVREGDGGFEWFFQGLPEILQHTAKRFHK